MNPTFTPEDIQRELARRAATALWARGNLTYKLDETQRKIKAALSATKERKFFLLCSRRLGKSFTLVLEAFESALKKPLSRILYLAPTGKDAADIVTDFSTAAFKSGGDALDLRDLLQGENHASGAGNLAQYLHFEQAGSNVLLHVSSAGSLTGGGTNAAAVQDQTIQLNGVTLAQLGGSTDSAIIQNLLTNGKLIVD